MAAWIVVGVVIGVAVTWLVLDYRHFRDRAVEARLKEMFSKPPVVLPGGGDQAMLDRVLDRLLEAVVPKYNDGSVPVPEEYQQTPGEYEEPDDARPVMDWTDPFIGLERPMVARLAPGEQIPGFAPDDDRPGDPVEAWRESGEAAFDDWMRETRFPEGIEDMPLGSWVQPVNLEGVDDERG